MPKRVYYSSDEELRIMKRTAKVIDFGVSLAMTSAFNEMYTALTILRFRRDLFKHQVKRDANMAYQSARRQETLLKTLMQNTGFWLDYSDKVIDEAANDVTLFRIAIKQELDSGGFDDSELYSYIECARVLLILSVRMFDTVIKEAKKDSGKDYTDVFIEFRAGDACDKWGRMCDILFQRVGIDLNTDRVNKAFDALYRKLTEGEYIQACLNEANKNNPLEGL